MAFRAGRVVIDVDERGLNRRHEHHRYAIMGPGGVQWLTIPLTGDTRTPHTALSEIRISEHANWRRTHWGALYSAYGRTPYFDYVADDLQRIIHGNQTLLLDFIQQLTQLITEFMQLPITFEYRNLDNLESLENLALHDVPYHQLWADRHGFQPNLSILDLMMNQGPEGIFTLFSMTTTTQTRDGAIDVFKRIK
ncbi:MAG: WbqC family protein [Muribaculaceae bacterium]|nr:WbqC family protein [Muribaculaceae bacterium]